MDWDDIDRGYSHEMGSGARHLDLTEAEVAALPLPPGWSQTYDAAEECPVYRHAGADGLVWEHPTLTRAREAAEARPLPPGWTVKTARLDDGSTEHFYCLEATGNSGWDHPLLRACLAEVLAGPEPAPAAVGARSADAAELQASSDQLAEISEQLEREAANLRSQLASFESAYVPAAEPARPEPQPQPQPDTEDAVLLKMRSFKSQVDRAKAARTPLDAVVRLAETPPADDGQPPQPGARGKSRADVVSDVARFKERARAMGLATPRATPEPQPAPPVKPEEAVIDFSVTVHKPAKANKPTTSLVAELPPPSADLCRELQRRLADLGLHPPIDGHGEPTETTSQSSCESRRSARSAGSARSARSAHSTRSLRPRRPSVELQSRHRRASSAGDEAPKMPPLPPSAQALQRRAAELARRNQQNHQRMAQLQNERAGTAGTAVAAARRDVPGAVQRDVGALLGAMQRNPGHMLAACAGDDADAPRALMALLHPYSADEARTAALLVCAVHAARPDLPALLRAYASRVDVVDYFRGLWAPVLAPLWAAQARGPASASAARLAQPASRLSMACRALDAVLSPEALGRFPRAAAAACALLQARGGAPAVDDFLFGVLVGDSLACLAASARPARVDQASYDRSVPAQSKSEAVVDVVRGILRWAAAAPSVDIPGARASLAIEPVAGVAPAKLRAVVDRYRRRVEVFRGNVCAVGGLEPVVRDALGEHVPPSDAPGAVGPAPRAPRPPELRALLVMSIADVALLAGRVAAYVAAGGAVPEDLGRPVARVAKFCEDGRVALVWTVGSVGSVVGSGSAEEDAEEELRLVVRDARVAIAQEQARGPEHRAQAATTFERERLLRLQAALERHAPAIAERQARAKEITMGMRTVERLAALIAGPGPQAAMAEPRRAGPTQKEREGEPESYAAAEAAYLGSLRSSGSSAGRGSSGRGSSGRGSSGRGRGRARGRGRGRGRGPPAAGPAPLPFPEHLRARMAPGTAPAPALAPAPAPVAPPPAPTREADDSDDDDFIDCAHDDDSDMEGPAPAPAPAPAAPAPAEPEQEQEPELDVDVDEVNELLAMLQSAAVPLDSETDDEDDEYEDEDEDGYYEGEGEEESKAEGAQAESKAGEEPALTPQQQAALQQREMMVARLQGGLQVQKHGRKGKPNNRTLFVTSDRSAVGWSGKRGATRLIPLSSVLAVRCGHTTPVFKRTGNPKTVDFCLSLVCSERTLDVEFATRALRDGVFDAMQGLVSEAAYQG